MTSRSETKKKVKQAQPVRKKETKIDRFFIETKKEKRSFGKK